MPRTGLAVLIALALGCLSARADDGRKAPPAQDPDPGFLEFLGSVDRLAELNPDYLGQAPAAAPKVVGQAAPSPPPQSAPNTPAGAKNE